MSELRARVTHGRVVLDEPTDLPEGTILDLVLDDEGDDLDATDRAALDEAITKAWDQIRAGQAVPADSVISDLRKRR